MRSLFIASRSQWENALNQLEDWLNSHEIDATTQNKVFITFDEVISNIFNHNKQDNPIEIEIKLNKSPSMVSLTFKDNCELFNPLNKVEKKAEDFGGWGLDIIKQLMDDIEYQIVDNENCLTVEKSLLPD